MIDHERKFCHAERSEASDRGHCNRRYTDDQIIRCGSE